MKIDILTLFPETGIVRTEPSPNPIKNPITVPKRDINNVTHVPFKNHSP